MKNKEILVSMIVACANHNTVYDSYILVINRVQDLKALTFIFFLELKFSIVLQKSMSCL